MDEPGEGTVLFLVNYLPGASNLRALHYGWSEFGICRAPSPLLLLPQVSHLQASSNLLFLVLHWAALLPVARGCLNFEPLQLLDRVVGGDGGRTPY